jgi:ABC-2 type transport system ATP-binding protein
MKKFEMKDWWNKKIEELSKGMQQKVQFISTVAHDPKLIILDEPFTGLDPVNTELIRNEILRLRENGATIIFSTHRMEQVEEICEDIVLINEGKVILEGKVEKIKEDFKEHKYKVEFYNSVEESQLEGLDIVSFTGRELIFKSPEETESNDLLKFFIDKNINIKSFAEVLPSLNDIFIKLVTE